MQPTVSYVDITDADSTQAFCMKCLHHFDTIHDLLQHYADSKNHNWCFACSKDFESAKRLRKHYRSIVHLPKNLQCPLCTKKFKYPSAVADHIESGKHKLTRKQVTFAVHSLGVIPTISVEGRIQQGTDISTLPSMPKLVANPSAFDGQSYRCHLPQCERTFRTLLSLEKHLNSAAHDEDEFKCPNPECDRAFKLVSGLIRHVESETCSLTNVKEVTDRFMAMTAQFTKLILSGSESS
ncbi:hypothetical protein BDQ17DRAFT_1387519 [Cyathus striatus]|nr:hypothetical protein BDQ17DRAFT_1387519 [Cyathus striatus]